MSKVQHILGLRGQKYGGFEGEARIVETIVDTLNSGSKAKDLSDIDRHAIYMICTKLARIVNGGTLTAKDSYVDIAGYAELALGTKYADKEKA